MVDHAAHTPYSDPGAYRHLVAALPVEPGALSAVARNVIVHYWASGHELPEASRSDIDARWVERTLAIDQGRHGVALDVPREPTERVQGCCRDHSLLCVSALREHGIPARTRVGFAGYLADGWHHDHVVVEAWIDSRWRRFDPEIESPRAGLPSPMDIDWDVGGDRGFTTAAQAWVLHRRGEVDATTFGVDPSVPLLRGEPFVFSEVVHEVAHRFGDELLLWDVWGAMVPPGGSVTEEAVAWMDDVAQLLLAADAGDRRAELRLLDRYRSDDRLHPGPTVLQASPFGAAPVAVVLAAR